MRRALPCFLGSEYGKPGDVSSSTTITAGRERLGAGHAAGTAAGTIVEPRGGGPASTIADALRGRRPAWAFAGTTAAGAALLAAGIVALGLLLTRVLLRVDAVDAADERLPGWMAGHREGWLNTASDVASRVGDVPVLPALVLLTIIVALAVRRLRIGVFLLTAILMEVALYRLGALAAPRTRPQVPRLDALPVDESFPSGHVAASVVVYGGLALLVATRFRGRGVRIAAATLAVAAVLAVAAARMYRGMHHPLDVICGALLGAGCLAVALLAVRAYGHARERARDAGPARTTTERP
jgi:membrane-associated phospholipid phosphatase